MRREEKGLHEAIAAGRSESLAGNSAAPRYTGSVHPPLPRLKAEDMTWKARFHSLRYVRPLLKLVWETSPPLVVASISLRLVRALMPLAMLWVPKLIIDAVVAW